MLKFLRKYQLIILVVGGTLLMVVFLLEPVLTRFAPNPGNIKVATISPDQSTVTAADLARANTEVTALARFLPALLQATAVGANLDPEQRNWDDHWYLLVREAQAGGFVGDYADGLDYVNELAPLLAQDELRTALQQGQLDFSLVNDELIAQTTQRWQQQLTSAIPQVAMMTQGATEEDVQRALAHARAIARMKNFYARAPKPTLAEAVAESRRAFDAVQADFLRIPASRLADDLPEASDQDLQAFVERFANDRPGQGPFGVGYLLPPRIKLSYLTLDARTISESLKPDLVELNKRWRQDRTRYPAEFAEERPNVEAQWRRDRTLQLLVDADQIVRAEVRSALRGLEARDGYYTLPQGWTPPSWASIADRIVQDFAERGVVIPPPSVTVIDDRWLTSSDLLAMQGLGQAGFQVGALRARSNGLPYMVQGQAQASILPVQPAVPIIDAAATDIFDNRYYCTVLDARPESPAENPEEAGRPAVVQMEREVRAYEALLERSDSLLARARSDGLEAVAQSVLTLSPEDDQAPERSPLSPVRDIRVTRDAVTGTIDQAVNAPAFRDAFLDAAARLDPLADPQSIDPADAFLAVPLPAARSLVLARVVAPRPLTLTEYRVRASGAVRQAGQRWLNDALEQPQDPFSFDALRTKWQYQPLERDTQG